MSSQAVPKRPELEPKVQPVALSEAKEAPLESAPESSTQRELKASAASAKTEMSSLGDFITLYERKAQKKNTVSSQSNHKKGKERSLQPPPLQTQQTPTIKKMLASGHLRHQVIRDHLQT